MEIWQILVIFLNLCVFFVAFPLKRASISVLSILFSSLMAYVASTLTDPVLQPATVFLAAFMIICQVIFLITGVEKI